MDKIEYSGALCFTEVHDVSKIAVQFSHFATSVSVGGVSLDAHSNQRSPTQARQRVEHRRSHPASLGITMLRLFALI